MQVAAGRERGSGHRRRGQAQRGPRGADVVPGDQFAPDQRARPRGHHGQPAGRQEPPPLRPPGGTGIIRVGQEGEGGSRARRARLRSRQVRRPEPDGDAGSGARAARRRAEPGAGASRPGGEPGAGASPAAGEPAGRADQAGQREGPGGRTDQRRDRVFRRRTRPGQRGRQADAGEDGQAQPGRGRAGGRPGYRSPPRTRRGPPGCPASSAFLSLAPNVEMAKSLTGSGVRSMAACPTATTGELCGTVRPAASWPMPIATAAVSIPAAAPASELGCGGRSAEGNGVMARTRR